MTEILSVSTLAPAHVVSANETKQILTAMLGERSARRVGRMVDASRIQQRHSVLPPSELLRLRTMGERTQAYGVQAVALGEQVARAALEDARMPAQEIDTLVCVSSTGFVVPSLDVHLINRLGLNPSCRRMPMTQLGCAGGAGALGVAAERVGSGSSRCALVVAVELPSLSVPVTEPSPLDILASTQFGDGAAAAVLASADGAVGPEIVATRTTLFPDSAGAGGVQLTEGGLRVVQSAALADLVRTRLAPAVGEFLDQHGCDVRDIGFWVVHPRSPQLLGAIAASLELGEHDLRGSWAVWREHGNMISASVFFILRHLCQTATPPAGALGLMLALGAGVSCEMALIRSRGWLGACG